MDFFSVATDSECTALIYIDDGKPGLWEWQQRFNQGAKTISSVPSSFDLAGEKKCHLKTENCCVEMHTLVKAGSV